MSALLRLGLNHLSSLSLNYHRRLGHFTSRATLSTMGRIIKGRVDTTQRLSELRKLMKNQSPSIDAFVVPSEDARECIVVIRIHTTLPDGSLVFLIPHLKPLFHSCNGIIRFAVWWYLFEQISVNTHPIAMNAEHSFRDSQVLRVRYQTQRIKIVHLTNTVMGAE